MLIRTAGLSDAGAVRARNDDHYCIGSYVEQGTLTAVTLHTESASFRRFGLLAAVADGMGGYAGGGEVSRIALETLSALYYGEHREGCTAEDLAERMGCYLEQTRQVVGRFLERSAELREAGTTLAGIALMAPDILAVFHLGDSRVLRANAGYLRTLTIDHTPLGEEVAAGRLTEAEAAGTPDATRLTRSLGLIGDATPDICCELTWAAGDTFLLGTDGWHGLGRGLPRAAIIEKLKDACTPEDFVNWSIPQAVQADGTDNATVVVVQIL